MERCWYDRSLGFILAIIFTVGGLSLIFVSLFAPEWVDDSTITLLGGIFGLISSLLPASRSLQKKLQYRQIETG